MKWWFRRRGKDTEAEARLLEARERAKRTADVVAVTQHHVDVNIRLSTANHWMDTIAALITGDPPLRRSEKP